MFSSAAHITTVLTLVLVLNAGSAARGETDRYRAFETTAALLDAGRNDLVALPAGNRLPPLEIADLSLEAARRSCALDVTLETIAEGREISPPEHLFLSAFRSLSRRRFADASRGFERAAGAYLAAADTFAAVVCYCRLVRSELADRDPAAAIASIETLGALLEHFPAPDRVDSGIKLMRGEALVLADSLEAARRILEKSVDHCRHNAYTGMLGRGLHALGNLAEKQQLFEDTAEYYREALAQTRALGATERTAKLLNDLGQAQTRLGNLEDARKCLGDSRRLADGCGADWVLGYVYYGLGALAEAEGRPDSAMAYFGKSVEKHAESGNTWSENGARLRLAYRHLGGAEYRQAITQYEHCLEYYDSTGSLYGAGWALGGLALGHQRLGNLARAEQYYLRTLDIRRRLGDRRGEAWCLNSLGMVMDMQARYREAFDYQHRSLEIYEDIGDRRGTGKVHFGIGSVYFYLGNYGKAMEHYETARATATDLGDADLMQLVASGISSVYQGAGREDLAETFCLEYLESTAETGDLAARLWALNNTADFYIHAGDTATAAGYVEKALSLLPESGVDHIRSRTLFLRGQTSPSPEEAIEWSTRALELARANGLGELQWKCLSSLGELYRLEGDTASAKVSLDRAIGEIEALRRRVGADELRRHMMRPAAVPYERMVGLIIDTSPAGDAAVLAYGYVERFKAQIFAALLQDALSKTGDKQDGERERRNEMISLLSHHQSRLQDGALEEREKSVLQEQIDRIERKLLLMELDSARKSDDYAAAYVLPADVTDLLETLRPGERMLSYFLGRDRSWLFCARNGKIESFELPDRETIEAETSVFIRLLRQQASAGEEPPLPPEVIDLASEALYAMLIGPVAGQLTPGECLVIVPDGLLSRLPFALLKRDGDCLYREHPLFYTPSLKSLYYLRKRRETRRFNRADDGPAVIAIGSRGLPDNDEGMRRVYPYTRIEIEPLPDAEDEARLIAGLFPDSRCLVGDLASEQSVFDQRLDRAKIIHIAAHSYVDNKDVRRSFVVLNPPPERNSPPPDHARDGLLQWHEITSLELNASLVTLSACRAAGGVLAYGEGITGLSQAFLHAGSDCVLASHLDVPDRLAGRFMEVFYRHLENGLTGAAALQAAQRDAGKWADAHPGAAQWGFFALVGDGGFVIRTQ